MPPKKGSPAAVNGGLPKGATKVDPPDFLPESWLAVEKTYLTGTCIGKTYIRYQSADGKHKSVGSVMKAIKLQAQTDGRDEDEAVAMYHAQVEAKKEETERRKIEKVEQREHDIDLFRARYGALEGKMVKSFPGWTYKHEFMEKTGQTPVHYWDTEGKKWGLLKDIEAMLGAKMMDGVDISGLVQAGREGAAEFADGESRQLAKMEFQEKLAAGIDPVAEREAAKEMERAARLKRNEEKRARSRGRKRMRAGTDSEAEDMEVLDIWPGDHSPHPGYHLRRCRRGTAWAVLPDDVVSVDLEAVGCRIEAAGWTRTARSEVRQDFVWDFQELATPPPRLALYALGGRLLLWSLARAGVECVACSLVDDWLTEGGLSEVEE